MAWAISWAEMGIRTLRCGRQSCKREHVLEYLCLFMYMCIYACACLSFQCVYVWTVDRTTSGPRGEAAKVSVNLCPLPTPALDLSLTGITNMTSGHATLATVPELLSLSLKNEKPLNTDYYIASRLIANMVWPQWTIVSE